MNSFDLKKILILLFLLVFFTLNAKTIRVKNLSLEDGLSQSSVLCMLQDKQGFIWFGTEDGLNRFDGYEFTVFRHNPLDSLSISDNHINCMYEDTEGNIWIGTKDGGINRFNPRTENFKHWKQESGDSSGLTTNHVLSIFQDEDHILWIGTLNNGLYTFDYTSNNWKHYRFQMNGLYPQALNTISCIQNNVQDKSHLWLGTFHGLLDYDKESGRYEHQIVSINSKNSLSDNIIWDLDYSATNVDTLLLIATNYRLNLYNPKTGIFTCNFYDEDIHAGSNICRTIFKIDDDNFLLGTMDGILKITISGKSPLTVEASKLDVKGLRDMRILSIFRDKSGVLWFGSIIGGVYTYSSKKQKFDAWTFENSNENFRLSNYSVRSIAQTDKNTIWIGTENKLNKINLNKNRITYWAPNIKLTGDYTNYYIWSLCPDKKHNLWIGTMGLGLFHLDTFTNTYRNWQLTQAGKNSINHNFIPCLLEDSQNILWIGTWGGGLNRFDPHQGTFTYYLNDPANPKSISHNSVWCLYEDSDDIIWIGTYGGGLNSFDRSTQTFKRFKYSIESVNSISNNTIYCIVEDADKNLWIGTNGGLNKFDRKSGVFTHFTTRDGLPNNVIYGIVLDKKQNIWLSTNNGLAWFDPDKNKIRSYTVEQGLQNNEFNAGAYSETLGGRIIFGGINGLNIFNPDSIRQSDYKPPIVFTDFKLNNQSVKHGINSVIHNPIQFINKIELSYKDKVFSIDFAALDYNSPEKNIFKYKLDGFDKNWIFAGNRHSATYTNLNPGNYILYIQGSNHDGIFSDLYKTLKIIIIPPYWQTNWFKLLLVTLIGGFLYLIYRYRLSRILELERMRIRIASDLHDDIGSTLTKIAINSEIIQSTKNQDKIRESSIKIGKMSRDIISAMSDIIWSIDARNDTLKNLLYRMRDAATTAFADKNVKVNFIYSDLPGNKKIPVQFRQNVFLIFKECLHNILKHADATEVYVTFSLTGRYYSLCVRDNGKGFDTSAGFSGNGIKNMKLRAERIQCTIKISNKDGTELCLNGKLP